MTKTHLIVASCLGVLLLLSSAVSAADGYPYKTASSSSADPWNFICRNCTSYVAWCMNRDVGFTTPPPLTPVLSTPLASCYFHNDMMGGVPVDLSILATVSPITGQTPFDKKLPKLELRDESLEQAFSSLQDVSGVSIRINWNNLETAGIHKSTKITCHLKDITVAGALTIICRLASGATLVEWERVGGVATISAKTVSTKTYPGGGRNSMGVTDLLQVIDPVGRDPSAERNSPNLDRPEDSFTITAPAKVHRAIEQLLRAYETPTSQQEWEKLAYLYNKMMEVKVSASFKARPLSECLRWLADAIQINIVPNGSSLCAAGVDPDKTIINLEKTDATAWDLLQELLKKTGREVSLTAMPIAENEALLVTTRDDARGTCIVSLDVTPAVMSKLLEWEKRHKVLSPKSPVKMKDEDRALLDGATEACGTVGPQERIAFWYSEPNDTDSIYCGGVVQPTNGVAPNGKVRQTPTMGCLHFADSHRVVCVYCWDKVIELGKVYAVPALLAKITSQPQDEEIQKAVEWAQKQIGITYVPGEEYYNYCQKFVANAYGKPCPFHSYFTAAEGAQKLDAEANKNKTPPPQGSWVFYSCKTDASGHVALAVNDGFVIHASTNKTKEVATVRKDKYDAVPGADYLGWAWPQRKK